MSYVLRGSDTNIRFRRRLTRRVITGLGRFVPFSGEAGWLSASLHRLILDRQICAPSRRSQASSVAGYAKICYR